MAEAEVLSRAPMYSPSEHFEPGLKILSNDAFETAKRQPVVRNDASDSTDYSPADKSNPDLEASHNDASEMTKRQKWQERVRGDASDSTDYSTAAALVDKRKAAYQAESHLNSQTNTKEAGPWPSRSQLPLLMSWWPEPEIRLFQATTRNTTSTNTMAITGNTRLKPTSKHPSILKQLENRVEGFLFGVPRPGASKESYNGLWIAENPNAGVKASAPIPHSSPEISDTLYHVVLTSSHLEHDVNSVVQAVRICGTYSSLPTAKAFAHRCLFDAGYEQEWFTTFKTQHGGELVDRKEGIIVDAIGPGGEEFTVTIVKISNVFELKASAGHRVETPLYHVVQTVVHFREDESGQTRDTRIMGSYPRYDEARKVAHSVLLWWEKDIDTNTYAEYEEAGPGELDCGYGENVVVHAVGQNGENFLVSVLKGQGLEAERVMGAASAMRA